MVNMTVQDPRIIHSAIPRPQISPTPSTDPKVIDNAADAGRQFAPEELDPLMVARDELTLRAGGKIKLASSMIISQGVPTVIDFGPNVHTMWDDDGYHDPNVNPSRVTCPPGRAGIHVFRTAIDWAVTPSSTSRETRLVHYDKNGVQKDENRAAASGGSSQSLTATFDMAVGDYMEVEVTHISASPLNARGDADRTKPGTGIEWVRTGHFTAVTEPRT